MNVPESLNQLIRETEVEFQRQFLHAPTFMVASPGRVNLIGEHTDYNDGFVLPMAIERYVVLAASLANKPAGKKSTLYSAALGQAVDWESQPPYAKSPVPWANYLLGVIAGYDRLGHNPGPFQAVLHSDLPLGGGLSSSAALEVAVATFIEAATGFSLPQKEKALLCQKAEHEFAGVPCGIMDQFTVVLGQAGSFLLLDCRSREVTYTPMADPQVSVMIINSNVKHALSDGEYAIRRRQCESSARILGLTSLRDLEPGELEGIRSKLDPVAYRRVRHVVTENARTLQSALALRLGDWAALGQWMYESHASLRDDYEVSCPELDLLVDLAHQLGPTGGVIGSRMTGGGFGGCTVSLVRQETVREVSAKIREDYLEKMGKQATVFVTHPAEGTKLIYGPKRETAC